MTDIDRAQKIIDLWGQLNSNAQDQYRMLGETGELEDLRKAEITLYVRIANHALELAKEVKSK